MSTLILFKRQFFRSNAIIQDCFSLSRKSRLSAVEGQRPWIAGLERLLRERRGLKKGELAALSPNDKGEYVPDPPRGHKPKHMRPGAISALLSPSGGAPTVDTLVRLMEGFNRWNRLHADAGLPDVELWEFFVTDEQSALLRQKAALAQTVAKEEDEAARITRIVMDVMRRDRDAQTDDQPARKAR